jgi:hypothetical protein
MSATVGICVVGSTVWLFAAMLLITSFSFARKSLRAAVAAAGLGVPVLWSKLIIPRCCCNCSNSCSRTALRKSPEGLRVRSLGETIELPLSGSSGLPLRASLPHESESLPCSSQSPPAGPRSHSGGTASGAQTARSAAGKAAGGMREEPERTAGTSPRPSAVARRPRETCGERKGRARRPGRRSTTKPIRSGVVS